MKRVEALAEQYRDSSNLNARVELHERFSTNTYGWHLWVFDQLDLPSQSRVLELGCGPGYLWRKNITRVPMGWGIALSDLSPGMLGEVQQNLASHRRSFRFIVADAQSIPFADGSFDAVIANHMLYHVLDRPRALSEIRRVLRPGGRFYASTVGVSHMKELGDLMRRFAPEVTSFSRFSETFTLENGYEQISEWFSNVRLSRYEDALVVTEVEPLLAYATSGSAKSVLVGDRLAALTRFIQAQLSGSRAIRITKDSGIFEAWRSH